MVLVKEMQSNNPRSWMCTCTNVLKNDRYNPDSYEGVSRKHKSEDQGLGGLWACRWKYHIVDM